MRTTIDPNLSYAATQMKPARKESSETSKAATFDDALNAAKAAPKQKPQKPSEPKANESTRSEVKKKTNQKADAPDQAVPSEESSDPVEAGLADEATPESADEQPAPDEREVEHGKKPEAEKVEPPVDASPADSVQIASMLAEQAQPQPAAVENGRFESTDEPTTRDSSDPQPVSSRLGQVEPAGQAPTQSATGRSSDDVTVAVSPLQSTSVEQKTTEPQAVSTAEKSDPGQPVEKAVVEKPSDETATSTEKSPLPVEAPALPTPQTAHTTQSSSIKPAEPEIQQQASAQQDIRFADENHPRIVTGIRGQLLPTGGSMTLRLDPPELGALQVQVHMQDGAMVATFQTSNDDATRMLSHSLASLKNSLESQGINVEKLQVQQAPRDQQASNQQDSREQQQNQWDNPSAKQEQQRREMLQRMWRKLAGAEDPLDLVA